MASRGPFDRKLLFNYPDGAPGAYSVIDVRFDRSVLNGPITVTMRFSTHDYIGKRGY